jgi:hypothetical protein
MCAIVQKNAFLSRKNRSKGVDCFVALFERERNGGIRDCRAQNAASKDKDQNCAFTWKYQGRIAYGGRLEAC